MSTNLHRPVPHLNWCRINSSIINQCINFSQNVIELKQIHCLLIKSPTKPRHLRPLLAKLLTRLLWFPLNNPFYARHLFDEIPNYTNQFTWTSLIRYYVNHYHFGQAISLYARMQHAGVRESEFTLSSVLSASARMPAVYEGRQVHTRVMRLGFLSNKIVLTSLMDMYAKCGFIFEARNLFVSIDDKDIVAWTSMIRGYSKLGMMADAHELFDKMEQRNSFSWATMVAGYANCGDMKAAKQLYDAMPERNLVSQLAMIAGYGSYGDVAESERIFGEILVPDLSCSAAMVACYSQNGYAKEAIEMYKKMKENLGTNEVALVGAISACVQLGDVAMASKLIDQVEEGCCDRTLFVSNALIHMHSKFGNIEKAQEEFNRMKKRDVVTYSTFITTLADHGKAKEAVDLFSKMEEEGIKPNHVCFTVVLNACVHVGMIEQGCKYFELMSEAFGIEPLKEHYACMVDLLGRAGEVEMAYRLIKGKVKVIDAKIWGSLLGACKIHGNLEVGEIAARHLFEMEPENTGNYVLLANTYARMKEWNKAEKIRNMMVEQGIRKFPGYSWISRSS